LIILCSTLGNIVDTRAYYQKKMIYLSLPRNMEEVIQVF